MSSAADHHDALLVDFCSLTGMGPVEKNNNAEFARSFLEGHAWQMDSAVNAYLEMKADGGAGGDDGGAAGGGGGGGEEEVRAPLPDKEERLCQSAIVQAQCAAMTVGG